MNRNLGVTVACGVAILCGGRAWGLPPIFRDISQQSLSKQYKVEAKSPDEPPGEFDIGLIRRSNFVYTCSDLRGEKVLWTRKQPAEKELPPVGLFVSDAGWTVIRTYCDDLVCVDPKGTDRGTVDVIGAFKADDFFKYVHWTTGGPLWAQHSTWYFLEADGRTLFVIRPWWGHRVVIDLAAGGVVESSPAISKAIAARERDHVVSKLADALKTRDEWESDSTGGSAREFLTAALLAGQLKIAEAVPDLTKLQDSTYIGSFTFSSLDEKFDGEVDHRTYMTFQMRQVVHLSLRRLGKVPAPKPVLLFDKRFEDYKQNTLYEPKVHDTPRHTRSDAIRKGMKPEEVLDLVGFPDFVGRRDTWEYDMDTSPPHTLVVSWGERRVTGAEKRVPALWKEGTARDESLAY